MTDKDNILSKQFIFFCGKGGVGKTTCAAATTVKLANAGHKTLLFSTDPAHSIADSLEVFLTNKITKLSIQNLYCIQIDAPSELKAFIKEYKNEITNFFKNTTYFDNQDIEDILLLTLPGIDELVAIKKIIDFIELDNDFEYLICDTAPTGHALKLLAMPDVINEWIKVLANMQWKYKYMISRISDNTVENNELLIILKRMTTKVKKIFKNNDQTIFNVVTVPEAMAIAESKRLIFSLNKMEIKVRNLIINNIIPDNDDCKFCRNYRNSQNIYIEELKQSLANINIISKLRYVSEIKGIDDLISFSKDLNILGVRYTGE